MHAGIISSDDIFHLLDKVRERYMFIGHEKMKSVGLGDLSMAHAHVFTILDRNNPSIMSEIALEADRDNSTITSLVQKMQKLNYVYKEKDKSDKRVTWVYLTKKGIDACRHIKTIQQSMLDDIFKAFSEVEKDKLVSLLSKAYISLEY